MCGSMKGIVGHTASIRTLNLFAHCVFCDFVVAFFK